LPFVNYYYLKPYRAWVDLSSILGDSGLRARTGLGLSPEGKPKLLDGVEVQELLEIWALDEIQHLLNYY
jgi:hypothetical protein